MSVESILKTIKDEEVKFVDIRFTDTKGKEQHLTVPSRECNDEFFEEGKMFDGSSIAGWKGINESDMILMPDASTAVMDPFFEEKTLIIRCDVVEPATGEGYIRCPRSVAKRAEAYLKASGVGDTAFFGPEPEFFIFDDVRWGVEMKGSFFNVDSDESSWNSAKVFDDGNIGHRPGVKGGYFPVPPIDSLQDIRSTMCLVLEQMGVPVEVHHHEVATAGQCEIEAIFIPVASAQAVFNVHGLFRVSLRVKENYQIEAVKTAIAKQMQALHNGELDVTIVSPDAMLSAFDSILQVMTLAVAGIGAISLVVSGILVMNVTLMSVKQRTAEIGLLKAVGAPASQVRTLFLTEAAMIAAAGAILGMIVGRVLVFAGRQLYPSVPFVTPGWALWSSLGLAIGTALLFAWLPAQQAANLEPVDALGRK